MEIVTAKFVFGIFYFDVHKVLFVNLPTFSTDNIEQINKNPPYLGYSFIFKFT